MTILITDGKEVTVTEAQHVGEFQHLNRVYPVVRFKDVIAICRTKSMVTPEYQQKMEQLNAELSLASFITPELYSQMSINPII